nr:protein STICHEL-like 3 [Tanacetum cinerariifolium]
METRGRKKSVAEPAPTARDPRDVETIKRLHQRIQELELQQDSPAKETKTESNVWDDGSEEVNHFGGGNPLLTKETESEPIWDIGDEEEEYPFVNKHLYVIEEEEGFVGIEESSERSFKDDSLLDAANLARDIYPGSSDNISKQKGQEDHVKNLSQQLNNVQINSGIVASSHNRVHGMLGSSP